MFRAYSPGPSLWESVLPPRAVVMPTELAQVDELLDDPVFFEPFRPFFNPCRGRRSIPMETFTRLTYPEVPLPARLRGPLPAGDRLGELVPFLPGASGRLGPRPLGAEEDGQTLWPGGRRGPQPGTAGQSRQ